MLAFSAHTDPHISLDSLSQGINTPLPHPKKTPASGANRDLNCLSPPGASQHFVKVLPAYQLELSITRTGKVEIGIFFTTVYKRESFML